MKEKVNAILLAGGTSQRLAGYSMPKQLIVIEGKYIINYCIEIYQNLDVIDSIILVINESYRLLFESIVQSKGYNKVRQIVSGGLSRQDSIYNGILSVPPCDYVVIQNGVSILTPPDLILECIRRVKTHRAVSAFVRELYSSFHVDGEKVTGLVDRNSLGHVRDPQVFEYQLFIDIHRRAKKEGKGGFTNDVIMLMDYGQAVYLVESPPENFKITTDLDIQLAHLLITKKPHP